MAPLARIRKMDNSRNQRWLIEWSLANQGGTRRQSLAPGSRRKTLSSRCDRNSSSRLDIKRRELFIRFYTCRRAPLVLREARRFTAHRDAAGTGNARAGVPQRRTSQLRRNRFGWRSLGLLLYNR